MLADGRYRYVVASSDRAGNSATASVENIGINTRATPISIAFNRTSFSPNSDGVGDELLISPLFPAEDIDGCILDIVDSADTRIIRFEGIDSGTRVWDGRSEDEKVVEDGAYCFDFSATYMNGNSPRVRVGPVTVDTKAPYAEIALCNRLFSPDGDGRMDTMPINQVNVSNETTWIGKFLNSTGVAVKTLRWAGRPPESFAWDGTSNAGRKVPDGSYSYQLASTDEAGNKNDFLLSEIRIDSRATPINIKVGAAGFSPNGDNRNEILTIESRTEMTEGISSWRLEAVNAQSRARSLILDGSRLGAPTTLSWDGNLDSGAAIRDGQYYIAFTVEYEKGNRPVERTATFVVDTVGPSLGLTINPNRFSPDGDSVDDTVRLNMRASDPRGVESWRLRILDPTEVLFTQFGDMGAPRAPIVWDSKAPNGELVQAAYSARDAFGNQSLMTKDVPVDVYIMSEGDRLRIQISSIFFAPFSPEFAPEYETENWQVLTGLAEVLKRYPSYNIRIEGHAVRIYWFNEEYGKKEESEDLAPLSTARAETAKRTLVTLGVPADRMSTIGCGGMRPVVPHSDLVNRWKSRRVEFVLEK